VVPGINVSEESFRRRRHSTAEDRARHFLVDVVKWVHRAFDPCFVNLQGRMISLTVLKSP
jgi:hypothetical protein